MADAAGRVPDITIVGAGLKQYAQLTLEAITTLRQASRIFYSGFNGDITPLSSRWNPAAPTIDLDAGEYVPGTYRPEMYERMAGVVLDAAARTPGVVVFQPGSALVVDSVTDWILKGAAARGLTVSILPGISCIEAVLAAIGYDAGDGLQIVQAQKLLLHRHVLNPAMAALVIQPGYYDTRWWGGIGRSRPDRFVALHDRLRTMYDGGAEMALVLVPIRPGDAGSVFWFRLEDLPSLHQVLSPFHTLFVPPAAEAAVDGDFLRRIDSRELATAAFERDADGRPIVETFDRAWDPGAASVPDDLRARSGEITRRWAERRQSAGRVPSRNSPTSPSEK